MTFKTSYNAGLGQPVIALAGVDTVQRVALGTILKGFDDVLGEGEFIYLPGVAASAAADVVTYDLAPGAVNVVRALSGTHANSGRAIAVAVAAVPAGSYGWYQISGCAIVGALAGTAAGGKVFLTATAGQISSTAIAGAQLLGAYVSTAVGTPAALQAYVTLNRPSTQAQIT
jgi:hypothetical protein